MGYDINKELNGNVQYSIPFTVYEFKKKGKSGTGGKVKRQLVY